MVNILKVLESLAPPWLASDWDNVGLQTGNPEAIIHHILLALTPEEKVVAEAVSRKADLIITHHPLFFSPIKSLTTDQPAARTAQLLLKENINLYCAHTNLDASDAGVSQILAGKLGLREISVLDPIYEQDYKLVVFVPEEHAKSLIEVIEKNGGKPIGNYTACTFRAPGIGSYRPGKACKPYKGDVGELCQVPEVRLETLVTQTEKSRLLEAVIQAHPYEEVAYDLYPLKSTRTKYGIGSIGSLEKSTVLSEFAKEIKKKLGLSGMRMVGSADKAIQKVAVVGGSGGDYIKLAARGGADLLVTGDVRYHQALEAGSFGLAVLDIGHYKSEAVVMDYLFSVLHECLNQAGNPVRITISEQCRDPFEYVV